MKITEDRFLGGSLIINQPANGYRAGADPVFLASAVPAKPRQSVLELGCGVGVAFCCLASRVADLEIHAVEREAELASLAEDNARRNDFDVNVVCADLANIPDALKERTFDHVVANPPFFDRSRGTQAATQTRESGRGEDTALKVWIDVATRRLKPGGHLTMIQRSARLRDVFAAMDDRMGSLVIMPLVSRRGRDAENLIIVSRKGGRAAPILKSPLILHDGDHHDRDRDSYSEVARGILRDGLPLFI